MNKKIIFGILTFVIATSSTVFADDAASSELKFYDTEHTETSSVISAFAEGEATNNTENDATYIIAAYSEDNKLTNTGFSKFQNGASKASVNIVNDRVVKEFFLDNDTFKPIAKSKTVSVNSVINKETLLDGEEVEFSGMDEDKCSQIENNDAYLNFNHKNATLLKSGCSVVWHNVHFLSVNGMADFNFKGFCNGESLSQINLYIDDNLVSSIAPLCIIGDDFSNFDLVGFGSVPITNGNHNIKIEYISPSNDDLIIDYLSYSTNEISPYKYGNEYSLKDDTYVRFIGRSEWKDKMRTFNFPGSGFEFEFVGTNASLNVANPQLDDSLHSGVYVNISVDGGEPKRIQMKEGINSIANVGYGKHTVRITRSSEFVVGTLKLGIDKIIVSGEEPKPVYTTATNETRKMEFIGDSYTVGHANRFRDKCLTECSWNTDTYYSYASVAARALGADASIVAFSSVGASMRSDGLTMKGMMIPKQFLNANIAVNGEHQNRWDFSNYTPDVVCVFVGTNDKFGSKKVEKVGFKTSEEYFIDKYTEFIKTIRKKYGNAKIVLLSHDMTEDGVNMCYMEQVDNIYNNLSKDDKNIYRLVFKDFEVTNFYHPSIEQHQKMADQLIPLISEITGWE